MNATNLNRDGIEGKQTKKKAEAISQIIYVKRDLTVSTNWDIFVLEETGAKRKSFK